MLSSTTNPNSHPMMCCLNILLLINTTFISQFFVSTLDKGAYLLFSCVIHLWFYTDGLSIVSVYQYQYVLQCVHMVYFCFAQSEFVWISLSHHESNCIWWNWSYWESCSAKKCTRSWYACDLQIIYHLFINFGHHLLFLSMKLRVWYSGVTAHIIYK